MTISKIVQRWIVTDRKSGCDGLRVGGKRVVGWSRRGARAGEKEENRRKKGKITKRRLVHIFSVKTAAAESGCGETGKRRAGRW